MPDLIKNMIKLYKQIERKLGIFQKEFEEDIGANELKKDVFNELRMEDLENNNNSKDE